MNGKNLGYLHDPRSKVEPTWVFQRILRSQSNRRRLNLLQQMLPFWFEDNPQLCHCRPEVAHCKITSFRPIKKICSPCADLSLREIPRFTSCLRHGSPPCNLPPLFSAPSIPVARPRLHPSPWSSSWSSYAFSYLPFCRSDKPTASILFTFSTLLTCQRFKATKFCLYNLFMGSMPHQRAGEPLVAANGGTVTIEKYGNYLVNSVISLLR